MKILVFCQRKKSLNEIDDFKVEYIVNKLENFIKDNYISDKYIFEYLTDGISSYSDFEADHKMYFDIFNSDSNIKTTSQKFMIEHFEYYDMIIFQTCPLLLVKKQIPFILKCVKIDGIVLFTNFYYDKEIYINRSNILNEEQNISVISDIVKEFLIKTDRDYNEYKKIKK